MGETVETVSLSLSGFVIPELKLGVNERASLSRLKLKYHRHEVGGVPTS